MPLVAFCLSHFLADFIICMCVFDFRQAQAKYGVGFGSALAIAISYTANHSILWAIIHGILGWLYVIYFALFRS
jgi:hypothetical protein